MSVKSRIKIILDAGMTVLMFVCMSFQFVEQQNHEIFGTILFVTFILHNLLNLRWYRNLSKGHYTSNRILITFTNFAMLMDMLLLMLSGMRISGYVFKFVDFGLDMELARSIHMKASYGGFLILGLHIGIHGKMISGMFKKKSTSRKQGRINYAITYTVLAVVSVYGAVVTFQRNFWGYISGRLHFVLFEYGESVLKFELDMMAVLILMAMIGYCLQRILTKKSK